MRMWEEWGADAGTSTAPDNYMIVAVSVDVRVVARPGQVQQWRPCTWCPRCGGKTWGHGWVARIFAEAAKLVMVPRRRCPGCTLVMTLRPSSHRARFQTAMARMREVLQHRLEKRCWPAPGLRQRFGHWLRKFHRWLRFTSPGRDPLVALREDLELRCLG